MIRKMFYVGCDLCGDPIGGTDQMADDAREARIRARNVGGVRLDGKDLCHRCRPDRYQAEQELWRDR